MLITCQNQMALKSGSDLSEAIKCANIVFGSGLTTYGYDQYGQSTRVTRKHSISAVDPLKDATSTYLYNNFGNVTQATDPENNVVKMPMHDLSRTPASFDAGFFLHPRPSNPPSAQHARNAGCSR